VGGRGETFAAINFAPFLFVPGAAAKLNMASETPDMHKSSPNKLRAQTKPDFDEEFLFMEVRLFYDCFTAAVIAVIAR
jgi:hypothetical protein